jgi:hypothetical protein
MKMGFKHSVERWAEDWTGWILTAILVLFGLLMFIGLPIAIASDHSAEDFIAECSQHEPHYQCVAKWRSGQPDTVVTPAPIVIPVGR